MQYRTILFLMFSFLGTQSIQASPFRLIDSVYMVINIEFSKSPNIDYYKVASSLNLLDEKDILLLLKHKGILVGEHNYDAEKLWQLYLAAQGVGTHSNIALCIRRANKFQTHIEAKERVRDEILAQLTLSNGSVPKWINFNDLNIIENKRLGASNYDINRFFRAIHTKFDDDIAWCAAYVGAKMKEYDAGFHLPQYAFRAASYGGFNDSGFSFARISPKSQKGIGRYSKIADIDYLPNGQAERYIYTIDDFKDKNKIPFGAMVIFKRQGGGHIGFVVGTVKDEYFDGERTVVREGIVILGGNQNDAVQFEVFYDFDRIRAVTIPSNYPKEDYSPIPEIKNFYDLPEFFDRSGKHG